MADISQIKLPNGDTFDLVDEKSGYGKIHIVGASLLPLEGTPTVDASYTQLKSWIDANEIVILKESSVGTECFYLKTVGTDFLDFMNLNGSSCEISANNIQFFNNSWLTINDLPIYDGTVE